MKRKICLALILLVILLSISAVSANENATGDITSSDDNEGFHLKTVNDSISSANALSFAELNAAINDDKSKSEISLNDNYKYDGESEFKNGIVIDRDLVIYGNGITIDGSNEARIFKITTGTATFYNINFINGNAQGCQENHNGGAILGKGIASDCNFTNNKALQGGAISKGTAINCNFKNNIAPLGGGAMYEGIAKNCNFQDNIAENETVGGSGGAMLKGSAENCSFIGNKAPYGGAIYKGDATNCNFIGNQARVYGGAMYEGTATNCNFTNNIISGTSGKYKTGSYENGRMNFNITSSYDSDEYDGGAMYKGTAESCNFIGNYANYGGGAYATNATNCYFQDNIANQDGGAICNGSATNCIFTHNQANSTGGAMSGGTAENSTFTHNQASIGGGMYGGNGKNCTFAINIATEYPDMDETSTNDHCRFIDDVLIVSNFTSAAGSGEKLLFDLSYNGQTFNGINTTILIRELNKTCYANSGDGWVVDLPLGTYTAVLSVEHANVKEVSATLNILYPSRIIAENLLATYGHDDYLVFRVVNSTDNITINNAKLSVKLNGKTTVYTAVNGQIRVPTMGLSANKHYAEITFTGNEDYGKTSINTTITVEKDTSKITAADVNTTYNTAKDLVITVKSDEGKAISGATLTVNLNDIKNYTTDKNGQIKIPIGTITPNKYTTTITFAGNENYTGTTSTAKVTVQKDSSKIDAINVTTTYNIAKDLVVTLKNNAGDAIGGAIISTDINGAKNYTTDNNGQIKIPIGTITPNKYTTTITFAGNEYYTGSNTTAEIVVEKAIPKIIAKEKTFKIEDKNKAYKITIKNNKGDLMKYAKVTLKVNGKTYASKTNGKGVATFKLTKLTKKGKFTAAITYPEDSNYKKATSKVKITVKDSPKIIAKAKTKVKNKKYKATLKTYKGSAMKKTLLSLKVKGQTYKAITNNKGVATFKLTKLTKKGKFTAVISYKGSAYYNKATKRVVISI